MPMMMGAAADPMAKRKTRAKIYGFRTFLGPGCPTAFFYGAFRDNVRRFVQECSDVEEWSIAGMPTWCTLLVEEQTGAVVPLYIVEECVRFSPRPFCDYCRCAGWSHHWVSKRRYHVIIPSDEDWDKPLHPEAFHRPTHILHGLVHCNGFGHLLVLNGRAAGSHFLSGCDLMDFFDRLCTALRVRAMSVEDVSRRRSLDLRLLLGVAYGEPWFARWGYRFATGSFGVTEVAYSRSLHLLASLPIKSLSPDPASSPRPHVLRRIAAVYRRISGKPLLTVRELLRYMLDMKHRDPPPIPSRWPSRRLRFAAEVIVEALREKEGGKMTRQEVRDAARLTIGDTGLLDYVIKWLGDSAVGGHVIRRVPHPTTRVLEFSLEEAPMPLEEDEEAEVNHYHYPSQREVEKDVASLYWALVEGQQGAVRMVLDCKHWVKRWGLGDESDDRLRFVVGWKPRGWEMEELTRRPLPPGEVVVVEPHASVGELLADVERAMRDTYCFLEKFEAEEVEGLEGEEWDPVLVCGAESGASVWVRGRGADMECELRYEGGADTWAVGCACGARDDDGERMVACDACDVWHHTRCVGIEDDDPVPPMFLCAPCGNGLLHESEVLDDVPV
ncbi:PHD finger protein MALE MEIOCYTE DEATH 1-like [Typha latifolia]|uniref:PHD finger protein MALE MEIOCYTE DEATH 1-like n=1 Tax=Typha latifolia TaxID=4733 RepID=UPI003C2BDA02